MKIVANDYEPKEVLKILREWSEKTQAELGSDLSLSRMSIQGYELGNRRFSFELLMKIAENEGYTITIEKK